MFANRVLIFVKSIFENGKVSNVLLFIGGSVSILWAIYFARVTVSIPYQLEFREGASQVMTSLLLSGENPFVFKNQPLGLNNYGLGYSAAVLPFAALFGNTLRVHRIVTFVFIFLSALIGFWAVYKVRRNISLGLTCGAFVMIGLMGRGGIGAFPSAMGVFLFLMAVLIPFLRSFDNTGLILSVFFSVVAFYTKAYFVLAFGIVASYLFLFVSKKRGMVYTLLFLGLIVVSFVAIRFGFPLYFINTVAGNVSNTFRTSEHLYSQLVQLFYYFYPVLILAVIVLVTGFIKMKRELSASNVAGNFINFLIWDHPVVGVPLNPYFYSFLCVFFVFVFVLGSHVGSYLTYAYQLVLPIFFIWLFQNLELGKLPGIFFVSLVLFNLFYWENSTLNSQLLVQGNSREWSKLYSYLESANNILNSPTITSKIVEMGITPLDSGQTIYYYFITPYLDSSLIGPSYEEFYNNGMEYTRFINDSIKTQKFDLIVTTKDVDTYYDLDLITEYYHLTKQIILYMPQTDQKWVAQIWYPLER